MESPIPSPIPSDQGSPSFVTPKVLVASDTLPIILSIQLLNSRSPEDESYDIHWNPIWEPSEEDFPLTPPGVSVPMSFSNVDDTSPITSEESFMTSGEIPIPTETSPFHVTSFGIMLPLRYNALTDIMGSRSPLKSSMLSRIVTPTSGSFTPHIHNVTSVPTIPTICVASSTPAVSVITASSVVTTIAGPSAGPSHIGPAAPVSGVVDPSLSAPPSSGTIPIGRAYDQYRQIPQSLDPQNPFNYYDSRGAHIYHPGPIASQPFVEVSVLLSISWGTTVYHGGQA